MSSPALTIPHPPADAKAYVTARHACRCLGKEGGIVTEPEDNEIVRSLPPVDRV